ncbi:MAG: hypothetical protein Q9227_007843 [Pyrenula ochraceoflavens]
MAAATASGPSGVSPSSSPRLPSPPPFTEVQIGPKSPSVSDRGKDKLLDESLKQNDGATRRIRPGSKAEDMSSGPPLVPLSQLDSPFQLQEHLKALYHTYTKTPNSSTTSPITRETAHQLANPPETIDRHLWLYELCRFLTMKANNLIVAFFAESPPCSASTCPEMRASEWQYLCAVHDPPKSCCAIDYCCHTLDWATNILTSPKYFPSRLTLGSEAAGGPAASMRHLTNIFRRVYRIFAHAWFQHRSVFWEVEGHDGLYVFFKTVCDVYQLIPEDNYTIPAEAEGIESDMVTPMNTQNPDLPAEPKMSILKPTNSDGRDFAGQETDVSATTISTGATTRRHKHTPSTGSHVTTIAEGQEEEEEGDEEMKSLTNVPEDQGHESENLNRVTDAESHEEESTSIPHPSQPLDESHDDSAAEKEHSAPVVAAEPSGSLTSEDDDTKVGVKEVPEESDDDEQMERISVLSAVTHKAVEESPTEQHRDTPAV